MSKLITETIEHATQVDVAIAGTTVLSITAGGVEEVSGANLNWNLALFGDNFAVGGAGALAQAVLDIGSFRKYNAWELPNGGTNPFIDVNFWLPPDYNGAALKVTLYLVKTATATGTDIVTNTRLACAGAADSLDVTVSSAIDVITTVGANNALFLVEHTVTPANVAAGDLCHGLIQRLPTNVADDYTGSVYLIGARVEYA